MSARRPPARVQREPGTLGADPAPCSHAVQAVKNIVGKAASGDLRSAASHVWQAAAEGGPRILSPQMDFLLRLASTGTYAATMILLALQARPERWVG